MADNNFDIIIGGGTGGERDTRDMDSFIAGVIPAKAGIQLLASEAGPRLSPG